MPAGSSVYYVGDDREDALQRAGLATEIARLIPGFDDVHYPEWDTLLSHWYERAHPGAVLALDEFPTLVSAAKEIPSLLQKHLDQNKGSRIHVVLTGSIQIGSPAGYKGPARSYQYGKAFSPGQVLEGLR